MAFSTPAQKPLGEARMTFSTRTHLEHSEVGHFFVWTRTTLLRDWDF